MTVHRSRKAPRLANSIGVEGQILEVGFLFQDVGHLFFLDAILDDGSDLPVCRKRLKVAVLDLFGDFVWATPNQADTWTSWRHSSDRIRQPEEIAPQEYCNALRYIIADLGSLAPDDCKEALRFQFGFKTKSPKLNAHIDAIFDHAVATGVVAISDDGRVSIPDTV